MVPSGEVMGHKQYSKKQHLQQIYYNILKGMETKTVRPHFKKKLFKLEMVSFTRFLCYDDFRKGLPPSPAHFTELLDSRFGF